ncbi:MAG: RidA family protein [Candidatus Cloacimonetes bacterium]|jgi:2-iminobutanoate/2-iminopropanoate deaminase|nr:RidA family protein [Candidatus Cloacimonadota bacterium]MBT4332845.1 RidA family protein [Candidatus Cloacimonadota bacterium]MBT4576329.1 RidA family protein [Candidatus Cloacimonadota bacterium]MBT5419587.1 RidA family protein [Candidatus Cloacimonadota bacterium]
MKKVISTENAPKAVGPYSQAVWANDLLFISGQIPIDPETGKFVSEDIKEQTKQVFLNLGAILIEAGLDFENIVKATVYLADMKDFAAMNEVYSSFFTKDFPARAAFQVVALPMGAKVEIEAIAMK